MPDKVIRRLPDVPTEFRDLVELRQYLQKLVSALNAQHQASVEGPINKEPFILTSYTDSREIDTPGMSAQDVADVLGTLIKILKQGGVLK